MNKIRLAQALVPIADELDERGLDEEASELDEIIQDLVSEAKIESEMQREAIADKWNIFKPEAWGSLGITPKPKDRNQEIQQIRNQIRALDQQLIQKQTEINNLRNQKSQLLTQAGGTQKGKAYEEGMDKYKIDPAAMQYNYPRITDVS